MEKLAVLGEELQIKADLGDIDFSDEHLLILDETHGFEKGRIAAEICSHILSERGEKQLKKRYYF